MSLQAGRKLSGTAAQIYNYGTVGRNVDTHVKPAND